MGAIADGSGRRDGAGARAASSTSTGAWAIWRGRWPEAKAGVDQVSASPSRGCTGRMGVWAAARGSVLGVDATPPAGASVTVPAAVAAGMLGRAMARSPSGASCSARGSGQALWPSARALAGAPAWGAAASAADVGVLRAGAASRATLGGVNTDAVGTPACAKVIAVGTVLVGRSIGCGAGASTGANIATSGSRAVAACGGRVMGVSTGCRTGPCAALDGVVPSRRGSGGSCAILACVAVLAKGLAPKGAAAMGATASGSAPKGLASSDTAGHGLAAGAAVGTDVADTLGAGATHRMGAEGAWASGASPVSRPRVGLDAPSSGPDGVVPACRANAGCAAVAARAKGGMGSSCREAEGAGKTAGAMDAAGPWAGTAAAVRWGALTAPAPSTASGSGAAAHAVMAGGDGWVRTACGAAVVVGAAWMGAASGGAAKGMGDAVAPSGSEPWGVSSSCPCSRLGSHWSRAS